MHYTDVNYNSPRSVRGLLEAHGIRLQKRFGQNFLVDPNIRASICRLVPVQSGDMVWEIGPGIGALTHELIHHGCQVTAFEIDHGLIAILKELFYGEQLSVVTGDCVRTLPAYCQSSSQPQAIVGNLPYNAASAIIMALLEGDQLPAHLLTMVQREAANRMAADPSNKEYAAYSVACQARADIRIRFDVPPEAFFPRPEVVSTVVEVIPRQLESPLPPWFSPLVRRSFQSRRKTLRNNLKGQPVYPGITGEMILDACLSQGIPPEIRAERIEVEQFIQLARAVSPQASLTE